MGKEKHFPGKLRYVDILLSNKLNAQDNSSYSTQAVITEINVLLTSVFLNDY